MRLENYPVEKFKKIILEIIGRYLNAKEYKVFFFGSRTNKKGGERSDIDVGIEGPRPVPLLFMAEIREAIENLPILYKIDIVDFSDVSLKFKKVAKENAEAISGK